MFNNTKEIRQYYKVLIQAYFKEQDQLNGVDVSGYAAIAATLHLEYNINRLSLDVVKENVKSSSIMSIDKAKLNHVLELIYAIKNNHKFAPNQLEFDCEECKVKVVVVNSRNGSCYECSECSSRVGMHKSHYWPLGTLASRELAEARVFCHRRFDVLWTDFELTRNSAYAEVSRLLGMPRQLCHIGLISSLHEAARFTAAADSVVLRLSESSGDN